MGDKHKSDHHHHHHDRPFRRVRSSRRWDAEDSASDGDLDPSTTSPEWSDDPRVATPPAPLSPLPPYPPRRRSRRSDPDTMRTPEPATPRSSSTRSEPRASRRDHAVPWPHHTTGHARRRGGGAPRNARRAPFTTYRPDDGTEADDDDSDDPSYHLSPYRSASTGGAAAAAAIAEEAAVGGRRRSSAWRRTYCARRPRKGNLGRSRRPALLAALFVASVASSTFLTSWFYRRAETASYDERDSSPAARDGSSRATKGARPRVLRVDPDLVDARPPNDDHDNATAVGRLVALYPAEFSDNTQLYGVRDSSDPALARMELRPPPANDDCVPMADWQTSFYPVCNTLHETDLRAGVAADDAFAGRASLFGTKGYWRHAWRLERAAFGDTVVLKTLRYAHDFEDAHFEHDRVDAVAMERLTSSPHVISAHGFCGHSVVTEYADGVRVGTLADKNRRRPGVLLRVALDIARGLADVHGVPVDEHAVGVHDDDNNNNTFVHLDVNPANVVSVGGTLKYNDFNIGILRRWNTTSNAHCGFPAQYPNPQWRSPEEANESQHLTEKVDVFSLGHIFFRLICGHEPWNKLEKGGPPSKKTITDRVKRGVLPTIPEHVLRATGKPNTKEDNAATVAIRDAMLRCYTFDPKERPSAREIADDLRRALDDYQRWSETTGVTTVVSAPTTTTTTSDSGGAPSSATVEQPTSSSTTKKTSSSSAGATVEPTTTTTTTVKKTPTVSLTKASTGATTTVKKTPTVSLTKASTGATTTTVEKTPTVSSTASTTGATTTTVKKTPTVSLTKSSTGATAIVKKTPTVSSTASSAGATTTTSTVKKTPSTTSTLDAAAETTPPDKVPPPTTLSASDTSTTGGAASKGLQRSIVTTRAVARASTRSDHTATPRGHADPHI